MSTIHVRLLSSAAILVALAAAPSGAWAKGGGGGGGGGGAGGGGPVRLGTTIVEGPITAINPAAGTITVAGALVKVPADGTATIHTPTATNLTLADLGNAAADLPAGSLPGGGIMGAHAVVQGTSGNDPANPAKALVTAVDVFTDIAESPTTGEVTGLSPLAIQGVVVQQLPGTGRLMPGAEPQNLLGFKVNPGTIPVHTATTAGDLATAQGYYGADGVVHYYSFQTTNGTPANATIAEASVVKAVCLLGQNRLTVLGGIHGAGFGPVAGQTVTLMGANTPSVGVWRPVTGGVPVQDAGTVPAQGKYKFDGTPAGGCPDIVKAVWGTGGVESRPFDVRPK